MQFPQPKFEIKVGDSFHLKFDKNGEVNHHDLDHFDPPLLKHEVGPSTQVSTHKAKKGEVNITSTTTIQNIDSSSTPPMLIGD